MAGSLGGATTTFRDGAMKTTVSPISAGDQIGGLEGWDVGDIWGRVDALRKEKFAQEKERMQLAHDLEIERMIEAARLAGGGGGGPAVAGGGGGYAMSRATRRGPQPMPIRDMFQVNEILNRIPRIPTGGITGTESWRNLPAAAAMTGVRLPESGFDVYAKLAGAGGLAGQDPYKHLQQAGRGLT
jgi:hypothetical protein